MKQNVKENGREQGLSEKDVARKFAKEQATARKKARWYYYPARQRFLALSSR